MTNVVEIVVYKVSDIAVGIAASLGIVEECRKISDGIVEAQTYQSIQNPDQVVVRVVWSSLEEARRVADWVFQNSTSFKKLNEVTTEQTLFDHFQEV